MLTQDGYHQALAELEFLMEDDESSTNLDRDARIEELAESIIEYENYFYVIERPSLYHRIEFRIDQMGGFWPWFRYAIRNFITGPS